MIDTFYATVALTIGTLLPIMNPFSTAPLFASLTAGMDSKRRNQQALLGCIYSFAILVVFLFLGAAIIDFFGISVPGVRVAGGLIVSTIGFRMLFTPPPSATGTGEAAPSDVDIAFTPLAMPSLAGPGSISATLTAAGAIQGLHPDAWRVIYAAVVTGMVVTLVFSYLLLRGAGAMVRFLGRGGLDAMTRIFGFLLICVGMQFLLTGISDFYGLRPG